MEHRMKLNHAAFERVRSGEKRFEFRLYDEKRRTIDLQDTITFQDLETAERLNTVVEGILRYESFARMLEDMPPSLFDWHSSPAEFVAGMRPYYSEEDERAYGVIAFRIRVV